MQYYFLMRKQALGARWWISPWCRFERGCADKQVHAPTFWEVVQRGPWTRWLTVAAILVFPATLFFYCITYYWYVVVIVLSIWAWLRRLASACAHIFRGGATSRGSWLTLLGVILIILATQPVLASYFDMLWSVCRYYKAWNRKSASEIVYQLISVQLKQ